MKRFPVSIMAVLLVVGLTGAPVRAQRPDAPPDQQTENEVKPYQHPSAWKSVEIGDYYFRRRKYKAALSRYQEAVTTDPHFPPAYLGMGKVYERIGLKQKALASYQRYLDELPSTKDALEAKGVQKAIARLEKQVHKGVPAGAKAAVARTP